MGTLFQDLPLCLSPTQKGLPPDWSNGHRERHSGADGWSHGCGSRPVGQFRRCAKTDSLQLYLPVFLSQLQVAGTRVPDLHAQRHELACAQMIFNVFQAVPCGFRNKAPNKNEAE